MTKTNMDLSELLAKHDQGDFLRGIAEAVLQLIMEADVDGLIGAGRYERGDCPSSDDLRPFRRLRNGGSGSSAFEAMRPAGDAASVFAGWSGV